MRLALIDDFRPAAVIGENAIDLSERLPEVMRLPHTLRLTEVIGNWSLYADRLQQLNGGVPCAQVRFRAPLPRPAKLLCAQVSFREGLADVVLKPAFFLKSSTSVIGPGDTVELPAVDAAVFHHEAELAVVIGKRAKSVSPQSAMEHVFGYTCFMDLSARGVGPGTSFQDKSYDTFGPMGPCIVTRDEVPDPHRLQVRLWVDGELRHDYPMQDIGNPIEKLIAYASSVAALEPGDVLALGVNHQGLGPIQHGETVKIQIDPIGAFEVYVSDPQRRRWEKGIDHGAAQAVRRLVRGEPVGTISWARRLDRDAGS